MMRSTFAYLLLLSLPLFSVAQIHNAVPDAKPAPESLGCIGDFICKRFDDSLSVRLFRNYWTGKGDIWLSDEQFAAVEECIREIWQPQEFEADTLVPADAVRRESVSFYGTKYRNAFGVATVYVDAQNRIVGFMDTYDFDAKRWGIRPFKYELIVRIVSLLSPSASLPFNIYYERLPVASDL
jgi:hypothetical protein